MTNSKARSEYGQMFIEQEKLITATFNNIKVASVYFRNKSELDGKTIDIFDDDLSEADRLERKKKVILIDLENGQRFRWNSDQNGIQLTSTKETKNFISKIKTSARLNPATWTEWHPIAGSLIDLETEAQKLC
ncbi:hypothetical protein [Photobacterium kishitanii]|uniref:Uncharacterized protein n=1 Tax=Photobacterium kishitanii TaxID=318456 RepID=A0A2T3KM01_9GAMM|nr:hypothetical protein [Photobacterium kishitanii]PSV00670.1 hypothetical protein C9J27_05895 [Photobacterium kishitanii]